MGFGGLGGRRFVPKAARGITGRQLDRCNPSLVERYGGGCSALRQPYGPLGEGPRQGDPFGGGAGPGY